MAEDNVGGEDADVAEPADRRDAVAAEHLLELDGGLRAVCLQRHLERVGLALRFEKEAFGAGIDLGGAEEAADESVVIAVMPGDEVEGAGESLLSGLLAQL